jgi:putative multiple sugar transport system permease protein
MNKIAEAVVPTAEQVTVPNFIKKNLREYGMLLSLVAIMVFFQYMTNGTLLLPLNLTNLLLQNSYIVIMALAMLLVIVAGHIDLSVGSVAGFIGGLAAILMVELNWHYVPATLTCLLAGALIGGLQGYFIAFHRIPAFIVTLGGMLVFRGATLALLGGRSVGPFPQEFQLLSSGFIPDPLGGETLRTTSLLLGGVVAVWLFYTSLRERANKLQYGAATEPMGFLIGKNVVFSAAIIGLSYQLSTYKGLPNVMVIMFVLMMLFDFMTNRTTVGRRIYALGGNEKAARLSGIKTERLSFYTFVTMGVLAALAGLVFAARLNTATPKAGVGFELDVIAACFIGGASATGGVGRVTGAVIGAFIMGVMNNGMSILGLGIDYQQMIKGVVLVAAVFVDIYNKNK